jgi:putative transposase
MRKLKLKVEQRLAFKVTTKRKHSAKVADNLLNQNFNSLAPNEFWAGVITYLKITQGWMYLAIMMDLYSRRIVGWHLKNRMTTVSIIKTVIKVVNLTQLKQGFVFHNNWGPQLLWNALACWDNAVVERLFDSLK